MKILKENSLFSLLIKNLPAKIHASNNKSGAFSKASVNTAFALKKNKFIEFNSKERITIVVFDKDVHAGKTALVFFEDILTFQDWILEKLDILPSYICQTTKGFQFGFVINGFMTVQNGYSPRNSPEQFLQDVKKRYIQHLELDNIASSRNHGIFRNPIKHKYIAYPSAVYDINDLNSALLDEVIVTEFTSYKKSNYSAVSKYKTISTDRNNSIFLLCCREFAYSKPIKRQIFKFANNINNSNCIEPLPISEIKSITNSIYQRCQNGILKSGSKKADINRKKQVKDRKKYILKFILKCKQEQNRFVKTQLAKELAISVTSLNNTYGDFINLRIKYI